MIDSREVLLHLYDRERFNERIKNDCMPSPLEILLDPISLCIIGIYGFLMIWEALFQGRKLPHVRYWKIKGVIFFFIYFYLSSYLPLCYADWLPTSQFVDLSGMNPIVAGILGVLIYELGVYIWHRTMHRANWLWRIFHQMHHSAERLDTYGAFYFSPLDMIAFTTVGTISFSFVAGVPPQAITLILLLTNFLGIFQHANIKTPTWLGYIFQRPESHAVHHARGVHAYNYSDLPVYDIIFGTFKNPKNYVEETGFYIGASHRIGEMLMFLDVSQQKQKRELKSEKR
jgi:sterol desaturase/sphingolipid hydroxylase (fatty acid hydroxylase superfamily)